MIVLPSVEEAYRENGDISGSGDANHFICMQLQQHSWV